MNDKRLIIAISVLLTILTIVLLFAINGKRYTYKPTSVTTVGYYDEETVQKIEDIRNRYILNTNEIKFDDTLEVNSSIKTYKNLEIESLDNYTYISTDSIKNLSRHYSTSEFYKIIINISITFILLFLLALVDLGLVLLYISSSKKYSILTVAIQVIIFNLFVNYIFSLFVSVFIFNCYGIEKKNFFNKLIFKLFVEKYIKYIYRIRLLMNKYSKELDFID